MKRDLISQAPACGAGPCGLPDARGFAIFDEHEAVDVVLGGVVIVGDAAFLGADLVENAAGNNLFHKSLAHAWLGRIDDGEGEFFHDEAPFIDLLRSTLQRGSAAVKCQIFAFCCVAWYNKRQLINRKGTNAYGAW